MVEVVGGKAWRGVLGEEVGDLSQLGPVVWVEVFYAFDELFKSLVVVFVVVGDMGWEAGLWSVGCWGMPRAGVVRDEGASVVGMDRVVESLCVEGFGRDASEAFDYFFPPIFSPFA